MKKVLVVIVIFLLFSVRTAAAVETVHPRYQLYYLGHPSEDVSKTTLDVYQYGKVEEYHSPLLPAGFYANPVVGAIGVAYIEGYADSPWQPNNRYKLSILAGNENRDIFLPARYSGNPYHVTWSPSGSFVVFVIGGQLAIAGTNPAPSMNVLTDSVDGLKFDYPAISPDGGRIAAQCEDIDKPDMDEFTDADICIITIPDIRELSLQKAKVERLSWDGHDNPPNWSSKLYWLHTDVVNGLTMTSLWSYAKKVVTPLIRSGNAFPNSWLFSYEYYMVQPEVPEVAGEVQNKRISVSNGYLAFEIRRDENEHNSNIGLLELSTNEVTLYTNGISTSNPMISRDNWISFQYLVSGRGWKLRICKIKLGYTCEDVGYQGYKSMTDANWANS